MLDAEQLAAKVKEQEQQIRRLWADIKEQRRIIRNREAEAKAYRDELQKHLDKKPLNA